MRLSVRIVALAVSLSILAACTQPRAPAPGAINAAAPAPVSNSSDESTGFALPQPTPASVPGYEIIGTGPVAPAAPSAGATETDGDISLNFVNANVAAVAQTIFGQLLKENYTVDGGVQSTITLQTTRPLTRDQVIPALETSLQMANLALTREADGYHIVPLANAAQAGAGNISFAGGPQTPGYGYEIIPLRYANAASVQTLIQPLAQAGVQIQVDAARNLLIIAGTSQQRAAIAANVVVFDVDWLAGMSYALVPLSYASAASVAKEVEQIIAGGSSPIGGLVRLVVIGQLNAILIISPQPNYLPEIRSWIARFDQQGASDARQVYVYRVQNGQAKDLASLLNNLLGTPSSNSANAAPAPDNGPQDQTNGAQDQPFGGTPMQGGAMQQGGAFPAQAAPTQPPDNSTNDSTANADNDGSGNSDSADAPPRIIADNTNNALLIYATPEQYHAMESALVQLDVTPQQVMLEAVVAEVTLTNQLSYGVQYFFQRGRVQSINTLAKSDVLSQALPGFSAILSPGQNIQVMLDALESLTHVNIISAPKLLVLNNQPAMLQVGDEVPITTQTAQSTESGTAPLVSTIQYQDTGVILHVTPRINAGGLVTLDMTQEVSAVSTTTSSTLNSPTISERKISTIVAVQDGQTVALGGLIQSSNTTGSGGIPFLGRIPVLGALFSNKDDSGSRTELLVMITPHVVQSAGSLQAVTEEMREQLGDTASQ